MKICLENWINIKHHLVVGDFNIDLSTVNNTSQDHIKNFQENSLRTGFQIITRPSTSDTNAGACKDHILIRKN